MASTKTLPKLNEEYGTQDYWNERYAQEIDNNSDFDWFKSYEDIVDLIHEYIPDRSSRVLILGCGNSRLSEQMYDDGYQNIVNVDYSSVVIEQMKARHQDQRPSMKWLEMDVRALQFDDATFEVIIDKGTMDAMMTAKGDPWNPPQKVIDDCTKEVDEVLRVLCPNGLFLYLTFGQPHFRKRFLTRSETTLTTRVLGDAFHYYLYIVKRL